MKTANLLLFVLMSFVTFSQEQYKEYTNSYLGKTYDIEIGDKGDLYIGAYSMDKISSLCGLVLMKDKIEDFSNSLVEAKGKYVEWVQTAKDNNVTELTKDISIKSPKISSYFKYGDIHFDFSVTPSFEFKITNTNGEVRYLLLVRSGKLQSSSNQFTDSDGWIIVYTSEEEISTFIDNISIEGVEKHLQQSTEKEDLFK